MTPSKLRDLSATGGDDGWGCGWSISLPSQIHIEIVITPEWNMEPRCHSGDALQALNLQYGHVYDALSKLVASPSPSPPFPLPELSIRNRRQRIALTGGGGGGANDYLQRASRWITAVLLRCDNTDYKPWQHTFMSLFIRLHASQQGAAVPP